MAVRDWKPKHQEDTGFNIVDIVVPDRKLWRLMSVWLEFTTSDSAANRQVKLGILDSDSDVIFEAVPNTVQVASKVYRYAFFPGAVKGDSDILIDTDYVLTPIPELTLISGWTIRIEEQSSADTSSDTMVVQTMLEYSDWMSTGMGPS